jgi:MSHA type pilus biogenesis protein MshL
MNTTLIPIRRASRRWRRGLGMVATAVTLLAAPTVRAQDEGQTSLATHTQGKRLFSFTADNLELKTALALFAQANRLNIVPDNDVSGTVTLSVFDLPLEQMMRALLEANDCEWSEDQGLIRINSHVTRTYQLDYLRLSRRGKGQSSATMTSSSSQGGAGSGGAGGASMGGGGMAGGGMGGAGMGGGMAGSMGGSSINLQQDNEVDFWKELKDELGFLLTPKGKESLAINLTAGVIQVTDRPSAHRRLAHYLATLDGIIERQVDIEAKLYDVTLGDQFQWGVNWQQVAQIVAQSSGYTGTQAIGVDALAPDPGGDFKLLPNAFDLSSRNAWVFGGPGSGSTAVLNENVVIQALQAQGEVRVVSQPRVRVLNNQTALIKVATDIPFFSQTSTFFQNQGSTVQTEGDQITTITVGTILALTPQISSNNWITLDISPTLSSLVETVTSPSRTATAPKIDIKQSSTLVRVPDGATIVMGGLIQDARSKTQRKVPVLGEIPVLGYLFKGVTDAKQKKELVMFVTPRIVRDELTARAAGTPGGP